MCECDGYNNHNNEVIVRISRTCGQFRFLGKKELSFHSKLSVLGSVLVLSDSY